MFEQYLPKKFCREFVEAQGYSGQLPAIMAVVSGIKSCSDVWIPARRVKMFVEACRRYGLAYKADVHFDVISRRTLPDSIVGKTNLTTTVAFGRPFHSRRRSGDVHFFIGRSRDALEAAFRHGWYPVIVNDRVMEKPLADAYRFGHFLGYPSCCVEFFQKYNDWSRYNFLFEILQNTVLKKASFLCNPFSRDRSYSYISHMPCSYGCEKTRMQAERLREVILKEEPGLARQIDRHLLLPYLVFYERKLYAFEGELKNESIRYRKVYHSGGGADYNLYEKDLCQGDRLVIEGNSVVVLKKGRRIRVVTPQKLVIGQENPFFAQWGSRGMRAVASSYRVQGVPSDRLQLARLSRVPNLIDEKVPRKDSLFTYLTLVAFKDFTRFDRLHQEIAPSIKAPKSELGWALKGYFAYLREDYALAAECFFEAVVLSPENFDNWNDLAFALRHLGKYAASERILFNPGKMIQPVERCKSRERRKELQAILGR